MKILGLHINHFGKLDNRTIQFKNGINLIAGENESGKTTLHTFLGAMLFGLDRGKGRAAKNDLFTRYQPWNGGLYGGVLELEHGGKTYSIARNFSKEGRSCTLTDETGAAELEPTPENLAAITGELTPALYANTLSVGQLASGTGAELADGLRNHIINLQTTGSASLDISRAVNRLSLQRKYVMAGYNKDARLEQEDLDLRIRSLENEIAADRSSANLSRLEGDKASIERHIAKLEAHSQQVSDLIRETEDTLHQHNISKPDDVRQLLEEVGSLEEDFDDYYARHRRPLRGFRRFLLILLMLLLIGAVGFCGYAAYLGYTKDMMRDAYPFMVGGVISLILIILLVNRLMVSGSFRGVCEGLSDIYEAHVGEPPAEITKEVITDMKKQLARYAHLFRTIEDGRKNLTDNKNSIDAFRSDIDYINRQLQLSHQETWQQDQKSSSLSSLRARYDMLSGTVSRNQELEEEAAAIDLAIRTMQRLSTTVFDSFGHFLQETASSLIRSMTDGAYTGIFIDNDLSISLEQNLRRIPLQALSSGTIDQVYLAFRLACIEFLWPDEPMPLFLDDTFALYDDSRLTSTLEWLSENYAGQIFIFSCHTREETILNRMNIPYSLIEM